MDEMTLLGYGVSIVITLGAFVAVIQKFTEPINELRIVMQKVLDRLDQLGEEKDTHKKRLDNHGERLDLLDHRVGKLETKVELYHDNKE